MGPYSPIYHSGKDNARRHDEKFGHPYIKSTNLDIITTFSINLFTFEILQNRKAYIKRHLESSKIHSRCKNEKLLAIYDMCIHTFV